jgi:hypothetical protein
MNLQEPPILGKAPAKNNPPLGIALCVFIALTLLGIGILSWGLFQILDTTAAFGAVVDPQGNPLPVQGYPKLWIGLGIAFIFSICALVAAVCLIEK